MPVEVMAGVMADMVGTLSEAIPRPAMLRADTLVSVLAVHVVLMWRGPRADRRALRGVHIIGMAVVTGEAVTGVMVTGVAPMVLVGATVTTEDKTLQDV